MRTVVMREFGDPGVLHLEEAEAPTVGPGEVRITVEAAGVNPADCYIRAGTYAFFKPDLPYTPGFDAAGSIEFVGSGVQDWSPGDRVYVSALLERRSRGTYAESFVCSTDSVRRLPAHLSSSQGACIGVPFGAAWRAVHQRAVVQPGETVYVHGASGAVGLAVVQLACAAGAQVIGTAGSEAGAAAVIAAGATDVLPHGKTASLTQDRAPSVIVEMLANENLMQDLEVLAPGGRVVIVGSRGDLLFTPRLTMIKEADVLGMALWNASRSEWDAMNDGVEAALRTRVLSPVVERELSLADSAEAHREVLAHHARGKIVLVP